MLISFRLRMRPLKNGGPRGIPKPERLREALKAAFGTALRAARAAGRTFAAEASGLERSPALWRNPTLRGPPSCGVRPWKENRNAVQRLETFCNGMGALRLSMTRVLFASYRCLNRSVLRDGWQPTPAPPLR